MRAHEYIQLHDELGFTVDELFQLSLNAVESSFLPEERREKMRERFIDGYWQLLDQSESTHEYLSDYGGKKVLRKSK